MQCIIKKIACFLERAMIYFPLIDSREMGRFIRINAARFNLNQMNLFKLFQNLHLHDSGLKSSVLS
jgi:hypothetical protein